MFFANNKVEDVNAYRFGWIKAMKNIQNNKKHDHEGSYNMHMGSYISGYNDATRHFNGLPVRELAYAEGLVAAYDGFYGQSVFDHLEK